MNRKVVWGFLGAAGIAEKNWASVRRSGNGVLKSVGSRDIAKAEDFIEKCQGSVPFEKAPQAVAGYDDILADPEIDAVYIPLPTGIRKEWVIRAAEAGKHVLCEKPCAVSLADLEEMTAACEANGVQFMDGVMFMHNARLAKILEVLEKGEDLGKVRRLDSSFSFLGEEDFEENIRLDSRLEPAGCLGDLGWYCIRMTLSCFGNAVPEKVQGFMLEEKDGVPVELRANLSFSDDRSASFHCSFTSTLEETCRISGTKGALSLDDFVQPIEGPETSFLLTQLGSKNEGCNYSTTATRREVKVPGQATNHEGSQETLLFKNFGELVLGGTPDPKWPEISLLTQRVMDAVLESAREGGVVALG
ncbi:MAG: Gfo/Idh/MocA family oxidoreductase [Akkermansiaceae bacterium]